MSIFKKKSRISSQELNAKFHQDFDKYVSGAVENGNFRAVFQSDTAEVYCILNTMYMAFPKTALRTKDGFVVGIMVGTDDFKGIVSGDDKFFAFLMGRNDRAKIPSYQVDEDFAGQILKIARQARTKGKKVDMNAEAKAMSLLGLSWYSSDEDLDAAAFEKKTK